MIPKKIHYIWLGQKPKNKLTELCVNSWYRCLSDYEIIEWNEDNLELKALCEENRFLAKCVKLKLWAFVSDYLRLYILYREGGIYLDTDVEVLKSFTPLLEQPMFIGYEIDDYIGTAVIGAEKGNSSIKRLLSFYDEEIWNVDYFNNPIIFKRLIETDKENFCDCKIYPQEYFSPYHPGKRTVGTVEKKETYSIHWYTGNWNMSRQGYVFLHCKHIKNISKKILMAIKKNLSYWKNYKF